MEVGQFVDKEQDETCLLLDQNSKWTGNEYSQLISKCQIQSTFKSSLPLFPRYCINFRGHLDLL